ncbi:MAG: hypothetical protein IJQ39_09790 [Thermoguttaceae bacterium]|nr:hypothetical protein [Thermoguttaceae bacterium]
MGKFRTSQDVHKMVLTPLAELTAQLSKLCDTWEEAYEQNRIARPDILINETMALTALATLNKYVRDLAGKLEDAQAGVYRYRDLERAEKKKKKT